MSREVMNRASVREACRDLELLYSDSIMGVWLSEEQWVLLETCEDVPYVLFGGFLGEDGAFVPTVEHTEHCCVSECEPWHCAGCGEWFCAGHGCADAHSDLCDACAHEAFLADHVSSVGA